MKGTKSRPTKPCGDGLPHYTQEKEMSCGVACLRMLAEWATGQTWTEARVIDDLLDDKRVKTSKGLDKTQMEKALERLEKSANLRKGRSLKIRKQPSGQPKPHPGVAHVLLIPSYAGDFDDPDAILSNPGHWIVVNALRSVRTGITLKNAKALASDNHVVGVVYDPNAFFRAWRGGTSTTEPDRYFQSWMSLEAAPILQHFAVEIENKAR